MSDVSSFVSNFLFFLFLFFAFVLCFPLFVVGAFAFGLRRVIQGCLWSMSEVFIVS